MAKHVIGVHVVGVQPEVVNMIKRIIPNKVEAILFAFLISI